MKTCLSCGKSEPAVDFGPSLSKCRECQRAASRAYHHAHRDEINARHRRHRAENIEAYRERNNRYSVEHKEDRAVRNSATYNPVSTAAHNAVKVALRDGVLVKPATCSACGEETHRNRIHAHHEDYSKPLVVRWLCARCHRALHAGLPESEWAL